MLVPYYSRREIDQLGALRGRNLEIAWVKDPIDLFFLHIQGSGLLRLRDGREISVGYAAQSGLPYRSIGRLLIDNGKVAKEEMSMQRLRRYLTENPTEQEEVFAYNESYVFFRVLEGGPLAASACRSPPADPLPPIRGCFRAARWRWCRRIFQLLARWGNLRDGVR